MVLCLIVFFAFLLEDGGNVLSALQDMHYINYFSLDLVVNQVVFEAFHGILANLGKFGVGEAAQFSHSWKFGNLLEGGFSSVEKSVACIQIIAADIGSDVDQILDDDSTLDQVKHWDWFD